MSDNSAFSALTEMMKGRMRSDVSVRLRHSYTGIVEVPPESEEAVLKRYSSVKPQRPSRYLKETKGGDTHATRSEETETEAQGKTEGQEGREEAEG